MIATFTIYGIPKGKDRPRVAVMGGFPHAYNTKQTTEYEKSVREAYLLHNEPMIFNNKNISMSIIAYYPIPKSFNKKQREQALLGEIYPTKKPDIDNVAKIIMDALGGNKKVIGTAYQDDTYIIDLHIKKVYDNEPRVEVSLCNLI